MELSSGIAFGLNPVPDVDGKRTIDQEKLKMLVLAVHNYHDATRFLPSSSTAEDGTGKPMHSWRVALLPYLEEIKLYEKIRYDEPWDSEYNKQFHNQMPDCFRSPYLSDEQAGKGLTNYVAIVGNLPKATPQSHEVGAIFPGPNSWCTWNDFSRITDGTANTVLFAECSTPVCWMDPTGDVPIEVAVQGVNTVKNGLGSLDGNDGINMVFCDGRTTFAPSMPSNIMLTSVLTCNGGEALAWEPERILGEKDFCATGTVTLNGKPLPEVLVEFSPSAATGESYSGCSYHNGQFLIMSSSIPSGKYKAVIRPMRDNDPQSGIIPKKYTNRNETPLEVQLKTGKNVIDLELSSNG